MFTIAYKGFYIHGYVDRTMCRITDASGSHLVDRRTLHAAKCWITHRLNSTQGENT